MTTETDRIIILDKDGRPVAFEDARILMEDELDAEVELITARNQNAGEYDPIPSMKRMWKLLDEIREKTLSELRNRQN